MSKRGANNRWVRDNVTQRHVKREAPWGLHDGSALLPVVDAARSPHLVLPLVGAARSTMQQTYFIPDERQLHQCLPANATLSYPLHHLLTYALVLVVHGRLYRHYKTFFP